MAKVTSFRRSEKAEQVINSIMKERGLNQSQATNYAIESFQSEPKVDSSTSPFSTNSTVWLLCWQQDRLAKFFIDCASCSMRIRSTCRPYMLLKKRLEQTP